MNKTSAWLGVVGYAGAILSVVLGLQAAGVRPVMLFHLPELVVVGGVTFFCLLLNFRGLFISFIIRALYTVVMDPRSEPAYFRIAQAGSRYSLIAGFLGLFPAGVPILCHLSEGPDYIGPKVCAMLTAVLWSLVLSQVVFRSLASFFAAEGTSQPGNKSQMA